MDTLISSSSSYTVGALIDEQDMEESAVISSSAVIRPLFSSDSADDPDALALRVVLRYEDGEQATQPVEYRERGSASRLLDTDGSGILEVDTLSEKLPTFSLPSDLAVGRYSLIFQVLGEDGVLYEEARSIFYIADKSFSLTGLASYPPGSGPAAEVPLFPTSSVLLLEAAVEAGEGLDPYLVWSFGEKRIAAARASVGGTRLLWKTPGTAGFHRIDVSLYPVVPLEDEISSLSGITRSLTIATSPEAAIPGLPKPNGDYEHIFRFLGDLTDDGTAASTNVVLESTSDREPAWLPFATGYGLAVGPQRGFVSDLPAFPVVDGGIVPSRVTLRTALRGEGLLWKAVFPGSESTESNLDLLLESTKSGAVLTAKAGGTVGIVHADIELPFSEGAVLFEIELTVSAMVPGAVVVRLSMDGDPVGETEIPVLPLSAEAGHFELGGSLVSDSSETVSDAIVAIVDDLALSLLPLPPPPPPVEPVVSESAAEKPSPEALD